MCELCTSVVRHAHAIPDSRAMQSLALLLHEIAQRHAFIGSVPRTPKRTIPDSVRHMRSAVLAFAASNSSANYRVISAEIAGYWSARQRANDARRANLMNPEGQAEPRAEPRAFFAPSDSCIFGQKLESPERANVTIQQTRKRISRDVRKAESLLQRNYVLPESEAAILAASAELVHRANNRESALAEYVSAQRHNPIRRSVADDVLNFTSCYH